MVGGGTPYACGDVCVWKGNYLVGGANEPGTTAANPVFGGGIGYAAAATV